MLKISKRPADKLNQYFYASLGHGTRIDIKHMDERQPIYLLQPITLYADQPYLFLGVEAGRSTGQRQWGGASVSGIRYEVCSVYDNASFSGLTTVHSYDQSIYTAGSLASLSQYAGKRHQQMGFYFIPFAGWTWRNAMDSLGLPKGKYLLKDFMTDKVMATIQSGQESFILRIPPKDAWLVRIVRRNRF